MYQLKFRLVKHLKMTVWTSVLWKTNIQLTKKWPDMAVKWPFISCYFLRVNQAGVMPPSTSEAITFYQSRFRPIKQLKMTVWTSVLWKTNIQLVEKWPKMVVKWAFVIVIHLYSEYNIIFGIGIGLQSLEQYIIH